MSYESWRLTKSDLGSEGIGFVDYLDIAYSIKHDWECIIKMNIPLKMMTHSVLLLEV